MQGYSPIERFSDERDIGGSLGSRFRATSLVTHYADQMFGAGRDCPPRVTARTISTLAPRP